jgi:hypothetical protein
MDFNFSQIKNFFFAPGDIFWKQKNGSSVLISKKGDAINFGLIEKLVKANHELVLENAFDFEANQELIEIYKSHASEILVKNKLSYRTKFIEKLTSKFINEKRDMSEINALTLELFWNDELGVIRELESRDIDLLKRNVSIASDYVLCAFLLGYYDHLFLSNLFTGTVKNLMELGKNERVMGLKEKLEYLRIQDTWNDDDTEYVKTLVEDEDELSVTASFERYDGSGILKLNQNEMSDLEIIFVSLNSYYGFMSEVKESALVEITEGTFKCETRVLEMLQKILTREAEIAA